MPYNPRHEFTMIYDKMLSVGALWPYLHILFPAFTAKIFSGGQRRSCCLGQICKCCPGY